MCPDSEWSVPCLLLFSMHNFALGCIQPLPLGEHGGQDEGRHHEDGKQEDERRNDVHCNGQETDKLPVHEET